MNKSEGTLDSLVVDSISSSVARLIKLDSLIVYLNFSIRSVFPNNYNFSNLLRGNSLDLLGLLEANLSWLVIINNSNSSSSVLSLKLLHGLWVIELDVEILIWLPVIIISNLHCDEFSLLSLFESQVFLNFSVIISGLGFGVDGANSNSSSSFLFVMNNDLDASRCLRH